MNHEQLTINSFSSFPRKYLLIAATLFVSISGFSQQQIIPNFTGYPATTHAYNLCTSASVQMEANPITGYSTYYWFWDEGGGAMTFAGSGLTCQATNTGAYTCLAIDQNGSVVWSSAGGNLLVFNPNEQLTLYTNYSGNCPDFDIGLGVDMYEMTWFLGLTAVWYCNGTPLNPQPTSDPFNATIPGLYTVEIWNQCTNSFCYSNSVQVAPLGLISAGGSTAICNGGGSVVLTAPSLSGYTFQWSRNGNTISGATNATYTAQNAGTYHCFVSDGECAATSNDIAVTVSANPSASVNAAGPVSFCDGSSVTLNAVTNNGTSFQWLKNNVNISAATNSSYSASATGNYKVKVTNNNGCSKTSSAVTIASHAYPAATITPNGPTTFCAGQSVVLNANTGNGYSFLWKKNGNALSGATNSAYTATVAGNYKVRVTNSFGCATLSASTAVFVPCKMMLDDVASAIELFPNPAENFVTIRNSSAPIESILFFDVLGKEINVTVTTATDFEIAFDVSSLPSGIYFAKVMSAGKVTTLRLMKE